MIDAATWGSLATAIGTLALAVATLAAVRSANRSARIAEQSMLVAIRPLLLVSRIQDTEQKVGFVDGHWVHLAGGQGTAEVDDDGVFLTLSLRNVGAGLALLHGWSVVRHDPGAIPTAHPAAPEEFHRLTRDMYIAAGDVGYWQGAIRDRNDPDDAWLREGVAARRRIIVDLLYADQDGGQRAVTRFSLTPGRDGAWVAGSSRYWPLDRPDPR